MGPDRALVRNSNRLRRSYDKWAARRTQSDATMDDNLAIPGSISRVAMAENPRRK